jgi:hypothetical protein
MQVAIVVGDMSTGSAGAFEMARAWRQLGATIDLWGHATDGLIRKKCREEGVRWHGLPPALMDGSLDSRRYLVRLLAGLTRATPDVVVGTGVPAGVACGLIWRTVGARRVIWYQPDARPTPVSLRALRLAAGWTPHVWAATDAAARLLIDTLGVRAEAVTVFDAAADPLRALAERAAALDCAVEPPSPVAGFAPRLVVRAVVQQVIEQEEQAVRLAGHLRQSGVRRVVVYGDGPPARILIAACRRRRVRVVGVAPLVERGGDLAIRRMALAEVFRRGGVRVVAIASREGAVNVAGRVRQAARACGVTATVVAVGHPGFAVTPQRGGDRSALQRALTARRLREIDRHVRPIVAALCRDRVRVCCIYGASDVGRAILRLARRHRIRVQFFIDGNDTKWGDVVDGVEIVSLAQAASTGPRVFAIGSIANAAAISAAIESACPGTDTRVYAAPSGTSE